MNDKSHGKTVFYVLETPLPCILAITGAASIVYQVWKNKKRLIAAQMYVALIIRVWKSIGVSLL